MNRDEKDGIIHDLTEQLEVERGICRAKARQLEVLEEEFHSLTKRFEKVRGQRNLAIIALRKNGVLTTAEIAELFDMDKIEVFDISKGE